MPKTRQDRHQQHGHNPQSKCQRAFGEPHTGRPQWRAPTDGVVYFEYDKVIHAVSRR
jgi:hypothetical protein